MPRETLATQIANAGDHAALKAAGMRLFVAKNLSRTKRTELVNAYNAKRRELDRTLVDGSKNVYFKKMLFEINNMTKQGADYVKKVGKTLYALVKEENVFSPVETDICYRAYEYQKRKAGIDFETATAG